MFSVHDQTAFLIKVRMVMEESGKINMVISVLESSWKWENVLLFLSASVEKHLYSNKYNCLNFFFHSKHWYLTYRNRRNRRNRNLLGHLCKMISNSRKFIGLKVWEPYHSRLDQYAFLVASPSPSCFWLWIEVCTCSSVCFSVELYCATLSLTSRLVVHLAESTLQVRK